MKNSLFQTSFQASPFESEIAICTKADAFMQMAISPCGAVPVLTHRFIGRGNIITRHSFNRQAKLYDLAERIDYIRNPDRQEHLYTIYCTTNDSDFWTELIEEN